MNRLYLSSLLILLTIFSGTAHAMQNSGARNAEWFYADDNPFQQANELYQKQEWKKAAKKYKELLNAGAGTAYDRSMACINYASCRMARGYSAKSWKAMDAVVGIPEDKRISIKMITDNALIGKSVLVKTNDIGIGDIFHFIEAVGQLKRSTDANIMLELPRGLKWAFGAFARDAGITLINEKDGQLTYDYETHIVSLLGYLKLEPDFPLPLRNYFTAPEKALGKIKDLLDSRTSGWSSEDVVLAVFLGENRQATLIGGKQLPRDPQAHGRHLDSKPFVSLLKKYPKLMLLDCGTKDSRITVDPELGNGVLQLPAEEQAFDTIIALAQYMNQHKQIVAIGADQGPANVFARSLDNGAQDRMAFIIPNSKEHDMRMNGKGQNYWHMLYWHCRVYKCDTPDNQEAVIAQAYADLTSQN